MFKTFFLNQNIRKLQKTALKRNGIMEYDDVRNILILFDLDKAVEVQELMGRLRREGKVVKAFAYRPSEKVELPELTEGIQVWSSRDLAFDGTPKAQPWSEFTACKPDLLLDLAVNSQPVLQYLSLRSEPAYRVGFNHGGQAAGDLLIEYDAAASFAFLLDRMHFYLKTLRTK